MVNRFYHFVSVVVTDWAYWIVFDRVSLDDNEWKAKISNFIKEILLICLIDYFKPSMAGFVLHCWFSYNCFSLIFFLINLRRCLIIIAFFGSAGLISLHFRLFWKFTSPSFRATKDFMLDELLYSIVKFKFFCDGFCFFVDVIN